MINLNPNRENRGLGQTTGGTRSSDAAEAAEIIKMLCSKSGMESAVREYCGEKAVKFVHEQVESYNAHVTHFSVSGKQLFFLRDIKDKLIEAGVL